MQQLGIGHGDVTVGIVHWAVPPTIGGVESHLADYIRLLHRTGVKVVMFSGESAVDSDLKEFAEFEYHPYLDLAGGRAVPQDSWWRVLKLSRWLRKKIREHGVNVIHGHNLHNFSRVPAAAINLACAKRIERHHTYHNYWENARCARLVRSWEGQWTNSEYVAGQCRQGYRGRRREKRLEVRYLGIDPDRFVWDREPFEGRDIFAKDPQDAPVILQPARLLRWKGPLHSVEMLRQLHEKGYRPRLVLTATQHLIDWDGERTELRIELDELIEKHQLGDWVTFLDWAHYRDMPGHYNQADIVINPSHEEPLGLVALEAMAASRPVVVTNSGGMTETFMKGAGALIVDNDRLAENLFEAVRTFFDEPEEAIQSGIQGHEHVVKNFHMRTYTTNMIDAYKASLARKRPKARRSKAPRDATAFVPQQSTSTEAHAHPTRSTEVVGATAQS